MSPSTITESCCCGARFGYTGYSLNADTQRRQFASEHKVCRERARPLVMWGGDQA